MNCFASSLPRGFGSLTGRASHGLDGLSANSIRGKEAGNPTLKLSPEIWISHGMIGPESSLMCAASGFNSRYAHMDIDLKGQRVNGEDWYGNKRAGRIASWEFFNGKLERLFIVDEQTGEFVRMKTWIRWAAFRDSVWIS